jgi:hypothetical protein
MDVRPVKRTRDGDYRLRLSPGERDLLRGLPGELRALLNEKPDDPALRRLFPPAYQDDTESEEEYKRLVHGELLAGRADALRVLEETATRDRLSADELEAWLRALNDLRLVLGTRLNVTEETYLAEIDPADTDAYGLSVFAWLTWLQEQVVAAAAKTD